MKEISLAKIGAEIGLCSYNYTRIALGYSYTNSSPMPIHTVGLKILIGINLQPMEDLKFDYNKEDNKVSFENKEEHMAEYYWDFGDNTNSTEENPVHYYKKNGTYTVLFRITTDGSCGEDNDPCKISEESKKKITIHVTPKEDLILRSDFTYKKGLNNEVSFTDMSRNAITYLWDFGDGETSTEESPKHIYAKQGNYTVKLSVRTKDLKFESISKNIIID
jgi:PKD repeat protein